VKRGRKEGIAERVFAASTLIAALAMPFVIAAIFYTLWQAAYPAMEKFSVGHFLISTDWDPVRDSFGALPNISGTLVITFLSLVFSLPLSLGIAIFVTEIAPNPLKGIVATAIDLLAAIPSVVYGMWGLFTLSPLMGSYIEPALKSIFAPLPVIGLLFEGTPRGLDILTASVILSIMLIPYAASITRESLLMAPSMVKEAAYSLGATKWEVIKGVALPHAKVGILSGIFLSLGRALGETMAVAFVLGNNHRIPTSLFSAASTITVTLANEFTEADKEIYLSSLFLLALILFVISFFSLIIAKFLLLKERER